MSDETIDNFERGAIAFTGTVRGFHFTATYPAADGAQQALIEIRKDGQLVKATLWPAYKVWNVAAHADDIAADIERGLSVAGDTLLGGNTYAVSR